MNSTPPMYLNPAYSHLEKTRNSNILDGVQQLFLDRITDFLSNIPFQQSSRIYLKHCDLNTTLLKIPGILELIFLQDLDKIRKILKRITQVFQNVSPLLRF